MPKLSLNVQMLRDINSEVVKPAAKDRDGASLVAAREVAAKLRLWVLPDADVALALPRLQ